jgi:hypothetical protein
MGRTIAFAICFCVNSVPIVAASETAKLVDYTRDIKPILSSQCYACHGPDEGKRKAKLRFDDRESALKKAIVPGKADESSLIARIVSQDPDEMMPPPNSKKGPVTKEQAELLRRWINEGARYQAHWAYVKPARPELPAIGNKAWSRNPIDHFIAAEHERLGLKPSPEADRITLIRRLSFDLCGLPPTVEEIDRFVSDKSPDAYEKLVERFFESKNYGERMALTWLDLVRFADSAGYHSDNHRDITLYRDYVIKAFNDNKPFDQFTLEQLAGDLLPNPAREQLIASGYNRLLMTTEEGGAQAKEYQAKYAADRVRNVSVVWMGSTMGCCECHNHKYDPFTMKDFYRLAAFFADLKETPVGRQEQTPLPLPEQKQKLDGIEKHIASLKETLNKSTHQLESAQAAWEKKSHEELVAATKGWTMIRPAKVTSSAGSTLTIQDDLSVLASGANPERDTYLVNFAPSKQIISAIRLEALTHPSLTNKSLSRGNGNFVLTEFFVEYSAKADAKPQPLKIKEARADFEQPGYPVANAIDGKPDTGWAVAGHEKAADRSALFLFDKPLQIEDGGALTITLKHESQFPQHNIGRFRLTFTSEPASTLHQLKLPDDIITILQVEAAKRTQPQKDRLAAYNREIAPELKPTRDEIAKLEGEAKLVRQTFPTTLVSMAVPPRAMRVLPRGNWLDESGDVVAPGLPAFLVPEEPKSPRLTRLDLAKWLVSADNSLVSRVFVNRLWKIAFGQGLVKSMEDFGTQGVAPTHAQLLDWLAIEFREHKWDVRHMLRLMVTSAAYRQSSIAGKELRERDPLNLWLARQGRFRIDAEMVRDNALSISGLLVNKIGGPSVKPYQPAGYWSLLNFPVRDYIADHGDNQYRRGLYTYWQRTFPHPSMIAFDAPSREECTADRPRSSTPLQALVLLNDPSYVEAARVFAAKIMRKGGASPEERIAWAYRTALSRAVKPEEVRVVAELYRKHLAEYTADKQAAKQLLNTGETPAPADLDAAELAAWTSVARVIFNLHETITRN